MSTPRSNLRVLILKPPNQLAPGDRAFTNGNLGAAYIVAALRHAGVETDYLDATVGFPGTDLQESFYRRTEMENGNIRVGMSRERLDDIISKYDVVATTSSFTLQTRMHFEIAELVGQVEKERNVRVVQQAGTSSRDGVDISLSQNLKSLNQFIEECKRRLKEDPNDELAREYLSVAYQQKAELLSAMLDRGRSVN